MARIGSINSSGNGCRLKGFEMHDLRIIQRMNSEAVAKPEGIGSTVVNGYGEEQVIVGESDRGIFWLVENTKNGQRSLRRKDVTGAIVEEK